MKKSRFRYRMSGMILTGVLLLVYAAIWWKSGKTFQRTVDTAGRILAGEGMYNLVRDSLDMPQVALTFDDGPNAEYTELLLDGLRKRNVKASFFLLGKSIAGNEELVKRMHREGHLIGNHTFSHVKLDQISDIKAREEIIKTNNRIYEITGEYPVYMRPPYGAWKKGMELSVEMIPVFWNVDTLDWKSQNTEVILQTVEGKIKDGAVILMHDEFLTTVEAALRIVDELTERGCEFVTVDRLILP